MLTSGFNQKTLIDIHHAALGGALFSSKIGLFTQKIRVKVYFFLKIVWKLRKNAYLCSEFYAFGHDIRPVREWAGTKLILWNETSGQLYGQSRKDVFERYCLCKSNFATLNLNAAVMQQRASTWVDFISPCGYLPFIYIIRCTPQQWVCYPCVYRWFSLTLSLSFPWELRRGVLIYHHWRGQA